ncbi:hypothetical protein [Listeria immobilis]|uniref:hypothetical protein n=1 Tax=Listeria immobilis TaxID=2713502 RepID=UPI001624F9C0|nr:hypothetical protein [Listeria immobilis]MBC1516395.1 hypothetical protein [Listeria immobilis]
MKKKWLILLIGTIVMGTSVFGIKWLLYRDNLVGMVQVDGLLYIVTNEPAKNEDSLGKFGEVEQKIKRYQIPDKDFTSNSLSEGVELYQAKNGDAYPRIILYKEEGEYYIASEAVEQPNQQQ